MRGKTVVVSGVLLLVAAGAAALFFTRPGAKVACVTVEPGTITHTVGDTGYVRPVRRYDLYAAAGTVGSEATVVAVPVKRGQKVPKGQVLVRLADHNLDEATAAAAASLAQAESGLAAARSAAQDVLLTWRQAQRDFARTRQLYQTGAATTEQFEQARTALATAQANQKAQAALLAGDQAQVAGLRKAWQDLAAEEGQLVVTSPAAGVVLALPARPQEAVAPGTLLATVGAGGLEVRVDILSDDMAGIRVGERATVTAPALGAALTGRVVQIYPQAQVEESALGEQQRRVPVIVALAAAAGLESGYKVHVSIVTGTAAGVLVVPREAVRTAPDGRAEVMAVVGGRVQYRTVATGLADSDDVAITGGLAAGDVIVKDATRNLPEGARVSPLKS